MSREELRVIRIVDGTSVDGVGLRTSIYFAGCNHKCNGCHNPQSWDFMAGNIMTVDEIVAHIEEQGFNVTFSGGDPLEQIEALLPLAKRLHNNGIIIWCYTGYTFEQVCQNERFRPILDYIDVLVDGPFEIARRDISLHFRGSDNQRLIDVPRTLASGEISTVVVDF